MFKNKILKVFLLTSIIVLTLIIGYSYAPSTSFQKEIQSISQYTVNNSKTTTMKQVSYSGSFSNQQITYEDLKKNRELIATETGIIPWLKYPREKDKNEGEQKAKLDATLETWENSIIPRETEVRKLEANNRIKLFALNYEYKNQTSDPNIKNPYGIAGTFIATSRTIAKYQNTGTISLTPGESYILAHTKDTGYDISKVQYAMYMYKNNGAEPSKEFTGLNPESKILAKALYEEAKLMDQYANMKNQITTSNGGQEIIDNMSSKYSAGEAGIVSYTEENDEFIIGPFSVNYARKVVKPITGGNSEIIEKDGTVVYGGIVGAELYGIENGKEIKVSDWEFIYPDVIYDATTKTVQREAAKDLGKEGVDKSIYPLPNEVFYIKIPNGDIEAISRLEFKMQSLNASGSANKLTGTYEDVNYYIRTDKEVVQTQAAKKEAIWGYVTRTKLVTEIRYDENGNPYQVQVPHEYQSWEITGYKNIPAEYTYSYEFYIEGIGTTKRAPNLYQIKNAKIYKEEKTVSIDLGRNHSKYGAVCIPLTMDIAGTVWVDGTEVEQVSGKTNGIFDNGEITLDGVIVNLYEMGDNGDKLVETKTTGEDGKYKFEYVKAGKKYYVQFTYDGMKYKNMHPLYSKGQIQISDYYKNTNEWLDYGHGAEEEQDRINFNNKFYEITTNTGISTNGSKTNMSYTYDNSNKGQIAIVQEFKINASTKTYNLIYPLHKNYSITNKSNNILSNSDKNIAQGDENYMIIGKKSNGDKYHCAATQENSDDIGNKVYFGNSFFKSYNYLTNINLALIERTPGDFGLKTDITQTIFTLNEIVANSNINNFGEKSNQYYSDFDIYEREEGYYNKTYTQNINFEEYTWRYDFTNNKKSLENDELQLYIQCRITILNQSELLTGYISELANYYDKELYYSNENWKYYDKNADYLESENGYAGIVIPKVMKYSSWAIKNNGTKYKENLGQVKWNENSKYGNKNIDYLNQMYTTDLEKVKLYPNETLDIFIIFKVERNENEKWGEGKYIINDNEDIGKRIISEVNGYRLLNPNGTVGGRVDIDSNPGNSDLNNTETYEDDIDNAPYLRVLATTESNGKGIAGYVWEDLRTEVDAATNQIRGNGLIDEGEPYINNIKVELIRLEYNKSSGLYEEVQFTDKYIQYAEKNNIKLIRYTGPQTGVIDSQYTITDGQYRFSNVIESGQYKVRFTYGTEEQFNNTTNLNKKEDSLKYNGHDYKSTEYMGLINTQNEMTVLPTLEDNPSTKVIILKDNSDSMTKKDITQIDNCANVLKDKLSKTHNKIQIEEVLQKNDNAYAVIKEAIENLNATNLENKVIVLFTDGLVSNRNKTREIILQALINNITVIGVGIDGADPAIFRAEISNIQALYYELVDNEEYVSNTVYMRIIDNIIYNTILKSTVSHSTDYLEDQFIPTTGKGVDGRINVMRNSQVMTSEKAHELNVEYINTLKRDSEEWKNATKKFAQNTQMTADSYPISITFDDNAGKIKNLNLGLQEIPQSKIEIENKVTDIIFTLNTGEKLISYRNGKVQNLQIFPNERFVLYSDLEIMNGSKIEVEYEIIINNIGEVDNLWTYLKYYPDNIKREMYKKLTDKEIEGDLYETLLSTVPVKINKIYNYYDNLVFSPTENSRRTIRNRLIDIKYDSRGIANINRDEYQNIKYLDTEIDIENIRKDTTVSWESIEKGGTLSLLDDDIIEAARRYNIVKTESIKNIELYPAQSKEVEDKQQTSSISTSIRFSKGIDADDFDIPNMLDYKNFVEIIETSSDTGRRDYNGKVGNYKPNTEITERDTDEAELVQLLPPFGAKVKFYSLIAVSLVILTSGVIFIKRKILK